MSRKLLLTILALFTICGVSANLKVQAQDFKVAIVDVQQIVTNSQNIQKITKDNQAKVEELIKYVEDARKDLTSITDPAKKKAAEEKYNKTFKEKKEKIDKDYNAKLKEIDESITKEINSYAVNNGYNLVLPKGISLYGGEDITNQLMKNIK